MACGCHAHDVKMLQRGRATWCREPNMSMWADISAFVTLRCAETGFKIEKCDIIGYFISATRSLIVQCRDRCKNKMISLYKLQRSSVNNTCDPNDSFT